MKQTIDLMKSRYRVIADWPSLDEIVIGDIIEGEIFESESLFNTPMHDFPHLFKKLEWWEERKPEDMPRYVAHKLGGYYEVFQWHKNSVGVWRCDVQIALFFIGDIVPISETEYNSYLKSKP